jgi:hypothetical protein
VRREHKLGRRVINKVAGQLAASFPTDLVASQALEALAGAPGWPGLKSRILSANLTPEALWAEIDLPQIPTLDEVRGYARARLAPTPWMDEIALSARQRLLELVYSQLIEATASSRPVSGSGSAECRGLAEGYVSERLPGTTAQAPTSGPLARFPAGCR